MDFRNFDIGLLVALDALLIEKSVTRAGERLHLSQPATSIILGRLRQYFGNQLLVPSGRRMILSGTIRRRILIWSIRMNRSLFSVVRIRPMLLYL